MNKEGESNFYPTPTWNTNFTLDEDARIKLMLDNRNGDTVSLEKLISVVEITTPDHAARMRDISNVGVIIDNKVVKYVTADGE